METSDKGSSRPSAEQAEGLQPRSRPRPAASTERPKWTPGLKPQVWRLQGSTVAGERHSTQGYSGQPVVNSSSVTVTSQAQPRQQEKNHTEAMPSALGAELRGQVDEATGTQVQVSRR